MENNKRLLAGLYIHVPFCKRRCLYCDFYSEVPSAGQIARYLDALSQECILEANGVFGGFQYDTIFLGGGTPSILNPSQIESLLGAIRASFVVSSNPEITIECNPQTLSAELLHTYRQLGVTRVSLGIQSFDDAQLARIGRLHDSRGARDSFELIRRAGYDNVSIDLIYGLPEQTLREWESDLAIAIQLGPEHISAYNFIIEPGAYMGRLHRDGKLKLPSEEVQGLMYDALNAHLARAGYARYELSNFARPGRECRHNLKYWHLEPCLGLGPGAVSFDGAWRSKNASDLKAYIDSANDGRRPPREVEEIDPEKLKEEYIMMALRLSEGLTLDDFAARFGYDLRERKRTQLDSLIRGGYMEIESGCLRLTGPALFISDEIILKLL